MAASREEVYERLKGVLDIRRFGNLHRLLQGVVARIGGEQSGNFS